MRRSRLTFPGGIAKITSPFLLLPQRQPAGIRGCPEELMISIGAASRKLFFKEVQPEGKEPLATVVLVHGAGGSHLSWRRQTDTMGERFRIIAVDLPGHGLSDETGESTISGHSGRIIELMDALGLEEVVLGGHSMGGAIALDTALRNPDRLAALLLVGTGARLRVQPEIFSVIKTDFELAKEAMAAMFFGAEPPDELVEEEKRHLGENAPEVLIGDFTACDSFDVMEEIASIDMPTLIVCGKEDRLTPAKYSEFLHNKIEGSEMVLFDNCGHMPMLERSAEFNHSVSSFLTGLKQEKRAWPENAEPAGSPKSAI